ncbi:class E sortase [Galactobacter valiniphilus]|nr:class E sortase [Galactobacter valiniphilus]
MARNQPRRVAPRRGVISMLVGGLGEILLTLGVVLLLFVVWQLWWTNLEADNTQNSALKAISQDFKPAQAGEKPPAVPKHPIEGKVWGVLYVPAFGDAYAKPIAEGVGMDVLDTVGVGHYPTTQMPGQVGNVALAGHRQTHGQVFWDMDKLKAGDKAYVQTAAGLYTYTYRSTEIVAPDRGDVLFPVPGEAGTKATEKLLTLTTCHPPFTTDLRMIVHLEETAFTPADKPFPEEIRELVKKTTDVGKG